MTENLELKFPPTTPLSFSDGESEIGNLSWPDGSFKFEGKAEESAVVFFNFLKPLVDNYIEEKSVRR